MDPLLWANGHDLFTLVRIFFLLNFSIFKYYMNSAVMVLQLKTKYKNGIQKCKLPSEFGESLSKFFS